MRGSGVVQRAGDHRDRARFSQPIGLGRCPRHRHNLAVFDYKFGEITRPAALSYS
jgi:hypothetical protein